jgi:Spherulation-specific family 4
MRPPTGRGRLASGLVLTLLGGLLMGTGLASADNAGGRSAAARASGQKAAVPAYWTPRTPAGNAAFGLLAESTPTVGVAILNGPVDGPPVPFDPETAAAAERLHKAGVTVLGYVNTGYLGRTGHATRRVNAGSTGIADWWAQASQDIADWYSLYGQYGVTGIFLDQALSTCGPDGGYVEVYQRLADLVRADHDEGFVAINPGTNTEECYARAADAIVIFENTYAVYRDWAPPAWVHRYPAGRFWHLVHAAPGQAEMRRAVALSKQRRAGLVYVTDDTINATGSPWNALPPRAYWEDELHQIARGSQP